MIAGAGLGLVIGVLLGLLGGGGSILAVPALVYGAGPHDVLQVAAFADGHLPAPAGSAG